MSRKIEKETEYREHMINPAKFFQIKSAWDTFSANHPKFAKFLGAAGKSGIGEGTIIEISITNATGETISSNLKLTESDMQLFQTIKEIAGQS